MKIEKDREGRGREREGGEDEENKIGSTVRWMIKRALKPYTVFFLERCNTRSKDRILRNTRASHAPHVCVNGIEVFGFVRSGSRCGKFIRSRVRQPVCRDSESTPVFDIVFIVC